MIDTLRWNLQKAERSPIIAQLSLMPGAYNVVTLHRPSNVDDAAVFGRIVDALTVIADNLPTVFPMHPRTHHNLTRLGLTERVEQMPGLRIIGPLGYLDFLRLMSRAAVVLTDSGGMQEETTCLGVWCLTLRENTERPITVTRGTNTIVGTDPDQIIKEYRARRAAPVADPPIPNLWDGRAAERIAAVIAESALR